MISWLLALALAQDPSSSLDAWKEGKPTLARRLAEEELRADPSDVQARVVLGVALFEHEGDLPRAAWHLERAIRQYDWWGDPADERQWKAHAWALALRAYVAAAMDDREAEQRWMLRRNEEYDPDLNVERGWGLMKLGRVDEARVLLEAALAEGDVSDVARAETTLCAIEGEVGDRAASDAACMAALTQAEARGEGLAVVAHNAVFGAEAALRLADTEAIARKGLNDSGEDVSNPWQALTQIYLREGRGPEAVDAIEQMQAWRLRQRPMLRDQTRASLDVTFARLLLVAGHTDKGLELVDRALQQPDRLGYSSGSADEELGGNALLRLAMRAAARERAREEAVGAWWWERWWVWLRTALPDPADTLDAAVVRTTLTEPRWMELLFQVYLSHSALGAPPWTLGDVIDVIGTGVAGAALQTAREAAAELAPWHDAFEAEIAWRSGFRGDAVDLAHRALDALPPQEALLRARTAAIAGDAGGGSERALADLTLAVRLDPGVLRRLQIALPARVEGSGAAATLLRRSPRLRAADRAFTVRVDGASACLLSPHGERLACASGEGAEADQGAAEALVASFHTSVFSLPMRLSRQRIDRLDGITAASREAAAERVDRVLEELEATPP